MKFKTILIDPVMIIVCSVISTRSKIRAAATVEDGWLIDWSLALDA